MARLMTAAVVVVAASGDNTLIAAPGTGKRLSVAYLKAQRTVGNTANTVALLKLGSGGANMHTTVLSNDIPGEVCWDAATELQLRVLPENTALLANLSADNSLTFTLRYMVAPL